MSTELRRPADTLWLLRFGYDGARYAGWARQPGLQTVEGELQKGLARVRVVDSPTSPIQVASRTDRGVSARANALLLTSSLNGDALLRVLNGIAPDIYFTGAVRVPPGFRVRSARRRTYRYFETRQYSHLGRVREAAAQFSGSIDARSFGRGLTVCEPQWRPVESVRVRPARSGVTIEVRAPSFVWGMVRKIVAALREVDENRLTIPDLQSAIRGRMRLTLPLAAPEPLVLWAVDYGLRWATGWAGPNRHQSRHLATQRDSLVARRRILASLPALAAHPLAEQPKRARPGP
jgi:tRNA pseudouridine38-40 synthase